MIVYVETNFLLELTYLQERFESCREILTLSHAGSIILAIPAAAIAEARATWYRRAIERREFHEKLERHVREIGRSEPFRGLVEESRGVLAALVAGGEESRARLEAAIDQIGEVGTVIDATYDVLAVARHEEAAYSLKPPDALVLASVRSHAEKHRGPKCFVSQDAKDFANPNVYAELGAVECKVIANFGDALAHIRGVLRK